MMMDRSQVTVKQVIASITRKAESIVTSALTAFVIAWRDLEGATQLERMLDTNTEIL